MFFDQNSNGTGRNFVQGCSIAVQMENNVSVKQANAEVVTAKTVIAIIDLAARLKQKSLWK